MKNRTETLEFLRSYQTQLHEARLLSEQLRELEEVVTRITPYLNQGVQVVRGPNLHKLEQSVERLEALRGELAQKLDAVAQAQARVVVAIELLEDERTRQMMRARYLLGKTWVEIGQKAKLTRKTRKKTGFDPGKPGSTRAILYHEESRRRGPEQKPGSPPFSIPILQERSVSADGRAQKRGPRPAAAPGADGHCHGGKGLPGIRQERRGDDAAAQSCHPDEGHGDAGKAAGHPGGGACAPGGAGG